MNPDKSPVVEKYPQLELTIPETDESYDWKPWPYVHNSGALIVSMYNWGMDEGKRGNFIRWIIGSSSFLPSTPVISNSKGHFNAPFFGPPGNIIYLFGGRGEHYFHLHHLQSNQSNAG